MSYGINGTGQVSVGTTPTPIIAVNGLRSGVIITNPSGVTVYLGGQNVSTSSGHALPAGGSISLPAGSPIYGVVASSTQTVTYIEIQ